MEVLENSLGSELWHACAGGMVQMPNENSKVFYFPQGHAEHALASVDFGGFAKIPSFVLCRVNSVSFLADLETDEVYAKMRLVPVGMEGSYDGGDDDERGLGAEGLEKPTTFAKTLTQSDANNGGGFSVPRYCAETIFPRLDYTADPPVQNLVAKDVHGQVWKFRHIYRGTPRRHLLTTGWSAFVNQKKLVAGDSVVFLRAENGEICVGVRRAKRGSGNGGNEISSGWNSNGVGNFAGFSSFGKEDENKLTDHSGSTGNSREFGRVRPDAVVEAAYLAANGQPFEVVYYPRASTPEFCVKASSVGAAMRIQWCCGMRFKMPFETEDSSRISWFMGTVAAVQFADPIRWPNSPWRMLQVAWDEPDLLPNVKSVSPWLVEMVSNVPSLNLTPFLHPRKKLRVPNPPDFPLDGHFSMPSFSGNPHGPNSPLSCQIDNITVGIQGARHAQIGIPFPDFHRSNKVQFEPLYPSFNPPARIHRSKTEGGDENENVSCLLSIGNSSHKQKKIVKRPHFVLFGQTIVAEQQLSSDESDGVSEVASGQVAENFAPEGRNLIPNISSVPFLWKPDFRAPELGLDIGQCKVFFESEDIGRILDLSVLASYEDLYRRLEHMLGMENLDMLSDVFYRDAMGACKQIGDEPFSKFIKTAKRLTIFMKSTGNSAERKLITGLPTAECGLDSSNPTGAFSIFV